MSFYLQEDSSSLTTSQVLKAYETDGFEMMLQAFNEPGYLEKLTGLDKLYDEGEAALETVDWDEDDEGDM
jgi:ubiquitin-like modifier-activating enzyme ATG7